jgi:hypothetical protein
VPGPLAGGSAWHSYSEPISLDEQRKVWAGAVFDKAATALTLMVRSSIILWVSSVMSGLLGGPVGKPFQVSPGVLNISDLRDCCVG